MPNTLFILDTAEVDAQGPVCPGDQISIRIEFDEPWEISLAIIKDPMDNRRIVRRKQRGQDIIFTVPQTRSFGMWKVLIQLYVEKEQIGEYIIEFRVVHPDNISSFSTAQDDQEDPDIASENKIDENTRPEGEDPVDPEKSSSEIAELPNEEHGEGEVSSMVSGPLDDAGDMIDEEVHAEDTEGQESPEQSVQYSEISLQEQAKDDQTQELGPISLQAFSPEDRDAILSIIASPKDLDRLLPASLDSDEFNDLEIPLAEIEEIDKIHQNELKSADLLYINHLLKVPPFDLMHLSTASLVSVKIWLGQLYAILDDPDHRLRKEYRRIRSEYQEYQRQMDALLESTKAQDPLSVLVGVNKQSVQKLREEQIETVGDLLQRPLVDLINLDVDPDKPLLPKLWIANAKSHIGIK